MARGQQQNQTPSTLEQYVSMRYMQDLSNAGFQPVCRESEEMIYDSLKMMASLNRITQGIRQRLQVNQNSA